MDTTNPARLARFERWSRLEDALRADRVADTETSVHENANGTLCRIVLSAKGGTVEVRDSRDRAGAWLGFYVWAEDRDGITVQEWPTARRADTVQNVAAALDRLGGLR